MSITVTTDVFCDEPGCCDWCFGVTGNRVQAQAARREAATGGWQRRIRGGRVVDLCPAHALPADPEEGR